MPAEVQLRPSKELDLFQEWLGLYHATILFSS